MIECYVLGLREVDKTQVAVTGGKGAHLGELSRIEGVCVPAGFCVATDAFRRIMRRLTVRNGFEASLVGDAPLLDIDRVSSDHTSCVESF